MNILLINYGTSNVNSIYNSLKKIKRTKIYINNFKKKQYDKVIFPGQGHIKNCMEFISKINYLENYLKNSYILGICIGYHLFFTKSEEYKINCLNLIKEDVKTVSQNCCYNTNIPNIGWKKIKIIKNHKIFNNLSKNFNQYFMHSYSSIYKDQNFSYGVSFCNKIIFNSVIIKENKFLFQFHPEKSKKNGLILLKNFIEL